MKRQKTILLLATIFITFLFVIVLLPNFAEATISSTAFVFGEVELGSSKTTFISISNLDSTSATLTGLVFAKTSCGDFSVVSLPESMMIPPNGTISVEIGYSPSTVGDCSDILRIYSGSPFPNQVSFSGSGIESASPGSNPTSSAQPFLEGIENILVFMDACSEDGSLQGYGHGNSAKNRLKALRTMLVITAHHLENGYFGNAQNKLMEIYKKTDGKPKPKDFVTGAKAPELGSMIQDLIASLSFE